MALLPLSHSWDMLKRLNFSPSIRYALSKDLEGSLPILPTLLSPKVTFPWFFLLISVKRDSFPLMCLEHPLSRYQSSSLAFRHTYKTRDQTCFQAYLQNKRSNLSSLDIEFGSNIGGDHILRFCSFWYPNLDNFGVWFCKRTRIRNMTLL